MLIIRIRHELAEFTAYILVTAYIVYTGYCLVKHAENKYLISQFKVFRVQFRSSNTLLRLPLPSPSPPPPLSTHGRNVNIAPR